MKGTILEINQVQFVVVVADSYPSQLVEAIRASEPSAQGAARHCRDVYQALAVTLGLLRPGQSGAVYVVVDALAAEEMQIFACLAQLEAVKVVAVSANSTGQPKLTEARRLGAQATVMLTGRLSPIDDAEEPAQTLERPSPPQRTPPTGLPPTPPRPPSAEPSSTKSLPTEPLPAEPQIDDSQAIDADAPAENARPQRPGHVTRPTLSNEELDALFG